MRGDQDNSRDKLRKEAMLKLLSHFDHSEGTTYLYSSDSQKFFLEEIDPFIRPQVEQLLEEYHKQS